jgi:hypothetical protein
MIGCQTQGGQPHLGYFDVDDLLRGTPFIYSRNARDDRQLFSEMIDVGIELVGIKAVGSDCQHEAVHQAEVVRHDGNSGARRE